jgi:hypothetical protein
VVIISILDLFTGLYDIISKNILLYSSILILVTLFLNKLGERYFNRYMPNVYVNANSGYTRSKDDSKDYYFFLKVKIENNTDTPLSFSRPQLYIRQNSRKYLKKLLPEWIEAALLMPKKEYDKIHDVMDIYEKVECDTNELNEGSYANEFINDKIRIEPHDFIYKTIRYKFIDPRIYKYSFIFDINSPFKNPIHKGYWTKGKISIKPAGSNVISKILYLTRTRTISMSAKCECKLTVTAHATIIKHQEEKSK